ncbi:MAG: GNAT family N-acetyltransferase [Nocardioidaceae bacterium]
MNTARADVTVRPAEPADAPVVAEIWRSGWPDGHLGNVPDKLVEVRTPEDFDKRAAEGIGRITVAVVGDDVAGFVMVSGDEVEQVYVSGAHRGSGVAGVLLTEAERQVRAGGHDKAWLAVVAGNGRARRFYERSGWVDDGRFDYPAPHEDGPISVPCHRYVKPV